MKKDTKKKVVSTRTVMIFGKNIKVASPQAVKESSEKLIKQYSQALDNLKNRD